MEGGFEYYKDPARVANYETQRFAGGAGFIVHHVQLAIIRRLIRARGPKALLDLPAGTGRIVRFVADSVPSVVGLDISMPMLGYAVASGGGAHRAAFLQGSAFTTPFRDKSFDMIVCLRFIRHLNGDDRRSVYEEMRRILKDGGVLVFDAVSRDQEFDYLGQRQYSGRIYDVLYDTEHELVEELGPIFKDVEIYGVFHFAQLLTRILHSLPFRPVRTIFTRTVALCDPYARSSRTKCQEWLVACSR